MPDLAGSKIAYFSFAGIIDTNGVTRIAAAMNEAANKAYDEVYLTMTSPGGNVGEGVYLYNHIRGLPLKVAMHNVGSVASIAVVIFVAAERRVCSRHGIFMVHPTKIGPFQEPLAAETLQAALTATLAEDGRSENILRERTSLPDAVLKAKGYRDIFISPQDALAHGLIHDIGEFTLPKGTQMIQI